MQGGTIAEAMLSLREAVKNDCKACMYYNLQKLNGAELTQSAYQEVTACVDKCGAYCEACVMAHELCDYQADIRRQLDELLEDRLQLQTRLETAEADLSYSKSELLKTATVQREDDFIVYEIERRFRERTTQLEQQLSGARAKAAMLEQDNARLSTEHESLKTAKTRLEGQIYRLTTENAYFASELQSTLRSSVLGSKSAADAQDKLKEMQRSHDALLLETNALKLDFKRKEDAALNAVTTVKAELQTALESFYTEKELCAKLRRRSDAQDELIEIYYQKAYELKNQLYDAYRYCDEARRLELSGRSERDALLQRLYESMAETQAAKDQTGELQRTLCTLKAELKQIAEFASELDKTRLRNSQLQQHIDQQHQQLTDAQQNATELRQLLAQATYEYFAARDAAEYLDITLYVAQNTVFEQYSKISALEAQLAQANQLKIDEVSKMLESISRTQNADTTQPAPAPVHYTPQDTEQQASKKPSYQLQTAPKSTIELKPVPDTVPYPNPENDALIQQIPAAAPPNVESNEPQIIPRAEEMGQPEPVAEPSEEQEPITEPMAEQIEEQVEEYIEKQEPNTGNAAGTQLFVAVCEEKIEYGKSPYEEDYNKGEDAQVFPNYDKFL